jgi:hypothetical protein
MLNPYIVSHNTRVENKVIRQRVFLKLCPPVPLRNWVPIIFHHIRERLITLEDHKQHPWWVLVTTRCHEDLEEAWPVVISYTTKPEIFHNLRERDNSRRLACLASLSGGVASPAIINRPLLWGKR